jgi:hypothetical protein
VELGNWLTSSSNESPVPSKQRTKVRPLPVGFGLPVLGSTSSGSGVLGSEIHSRLCWKGGSQVKHASTVGLKKPFSVSTAAGVGRGMRQSWEGASSRELVDMLGGGGSERNGEGL